MTKLSSLLVFVTLLLASPASGQMSLDVITVVPIQNLIEAPITFHQTAQSSHNWNQIERNNSNSKLDFQRFAVAPNGNWLASFVAAEDTADGETLSGRFMCLYEFATQIWNCHQMGEGAEPASANVLHWSPDSQFIAFTESYPDGDESDLWIFHADSGEVINWTDDDLIDTGDETCSPKYPCDLSPRWTAEGGLYFFKYAADENSSEVTLFHVSSSPATLIDAFKGNTLPEPPRRVIEIPEIDGQTPDVLESEYNNLDGTASISSSRPLLSVFTVDSQQFSAPVTSVWIFDLAQEKVVSLFTLSELTSSFPDWLPPEVMITSMKWNEDLTLTLLTVQGIRDQRTGFWQLPLIWNVDAKTGNIVDESVYSDYSSLSEAVNSRLSPIITLPMNGVVLPSGEWLYTNFQSGNLLLLSTPQLLQSEPVILHSAEFLFDYPPGPATYGINGNILRMYVYGYLYTLRITGV